jgi:pyrimidine deaminase RibD-like protein
MAQRVVTGFVDYVGLGRFVRVEAPSGAAGDAAELRVGIIVANRDLQAITPCVESMQLAVDGVLFRATTYVAEPADGVPDHTGVTWTCEPVALEGMADTTFQAPFEQRLVNVELADPRLVGSVFKGARFNGKPTASDMYGPYGGAAGRVSDFMGYGTLQPSPSGAEHEWRVAVTFSDWPRTPAWHLYDTLFVNGVSCTVVRCVSPTECDVVAPPRLAATSTLATVTARELPAHVNIEIASLQHAVSMAKLFDTPESTDEHFMRLAMLEGDRGRTRSGPNPWSGAVVVDDASRLVLGAASCNSIDGTHPEVACLIHARQAWPERFVPMGPAHPGRQGPSDASVSSSDEDEHSDDDDDNNNNTDEEAEAAAARPTDPSRYHGLTLYVTHTPCMHRTDSHGAQVDACVHLLADYAPQLRRVVIGVHQTGPQAISALKAALPHTTVDVMPSDTELGAELRWALREYLHWQRTRQPYVTALRVCDLSGQDVPRAAYEQELAPFLNALRALAQAVITDGRTLVANPGLFEGLVPHEAIQLNMRVPKARPAYSKHKDRPPKHRTVRQPFPMRLLLTDAATLGLAIDARKAALAKSETLGLTTVYTTAPFITEDAVVHRALLADNPIITGAQKEATKEALANLVTTLWPIEPNLQITRAADDDTPLCPHPEAALNDLGALGVVTAFVDSELPLIEHLLALGVVRELVTVTLPIFVPPSSSQPRPRYAPADQVVSLIACGQIGQSDVSFAHYLVTPKPPKPTRNEEGEEEKKRASTQ